MRADESKVESMLTSRCIPPPPVQRIAHHRAPAESRHRAPDVLLLLLDGVVDIEERHARLDRVVRVLVVDLDDLAHALQVQDDGPFDAWSRAAVAEILAPGDSPDGDGVGVADLEDGLDVLDGDGEETGGAASPLLLPFVLVLGIGVCIAHAVVVRGEHAVLAEDGVELGDNSLPGGGV